MTETMLALGLAVALMGSVTDRSSRAGKGALTSPVARAVKESVTGPDRGWAGGCGGSCGKACGEALTGAETEIWLNLEP